MQFVDLLRLKSRNINPSNGATSILVHRSEYVINKTYPDYTRRGKFSILLLLLLLSLFVFYFVVSAAYVYVYVFVVFVVVVVVVVVVVECSISPQQMVEQLA
jgi:hypothetical protein